MTSYAARPAAALSTPGANAAPARRAVEDRLADVEDARIGRRARRDLGTDAGGIADGDRDAGFHGSDCRSRIQRQSPQEPQPPDPQLSDPQPPPDPQPDGLSQPPSLPQPPCCTPLAFGSS